MADYPGSLHDWTDITDFVSVISDAHINEAHAEIIAIEQEQIDFRSRFFVYRNVTNQSLPNGVATHLQFNAQAFDEKSEISIVDPWEFVAAEAGYYFFGTKIYFSSWVSNKLCVIYILKNGTAITRTIKHPANTYATTFAASVLAYLSQGDEIHCECKQSTGSSKNYLKGIYESYFWGHRLS